MTSTHTRRPKKNFYVTTERAVKRSEVERAEVGNEGVKVEVWIERAVGACPSARLIRGLDGLTEPIC